MDDALSLALIAKLDEEKLPYTGTTKELHMNNQSIAAVNQLKFADNYNDSLIFREYESSADGKLKRVVYNSDGTLNKVISEQTPEGVLTLPSQPYVDVYKSSAQSIASSTNVKITNLLESVDRQNEFDADAITIKTQGIYAIYGTVDWDAFTANRINLRLYINGSYAFSISEHSTSTAMTTTSIGTVIKNLLVGDKLEFYAYQNNGNPFNITAARFRVVKIA